MFWRQAEEARQAAADLGKKIKEIDLRLSGVAEPAQKAALQKQQQDSKTHQRQHEDAAKAAQREGDAIYWPIYNLDAKNPHAKEALEHIPPQDLVAAMRAKQQEVADLLAEIDHLLRMP